MRQCLQADRLCPGEAKVGGDRLRLRRHDQVLLGPIASLRVCVTLQEVDYLPRSDLLLEGLLDPAAGQHSVHHVRELADRLDYLLQDLPVYFAAGVREDTEIIFDDDEPLAIRLGQAREILHIDLLALEIADTRQEEALHQSSDVELLAVLVDVLEQAHELEIALDLIHGSLDVVLQLTITVLESAQFVHLIPLRQGQVQDQFDQLYLQLLAVSPGREHELDVLPQNDMHLRGRVLQDKMEAIAGQLVISVRSLRQKLCVY